MDTLRTFLLLGCVSAGWFFSVVGRAADWQVDHPIPGVWVLRNETGAWGGFSMGVSHINTPRYQARKIFDLRSLPPEVVQRAKSARLRFYFSIQDYSWANGGPGNGLNESFDIVAGKHILTFSTDDPRFPAKGAQNDPLRADWVDVDLPLDCLRGDTLTVTLRKRPGTDDDYIYPGIDNTVDNSASRVSFDGGATWHAEKLNTIDAKGEYIMRLVLCEREPRARATWSPSQEPVDPHGLIAYHETGSDGLRIELEERAFDPFQVIVAKATFRGPAPRLTWLGETEKALPARETTAPGALTSTLLPGRRRIAALRLVPAAGTRIRNLHIDYGLPTTAPKPLVDLCPPIRPPGGKALAAAPACKLEKDRAILSNSHLRAEFRLRPVFALDSLVCAEVGRNVLAHPEQCHVFRIKVNNRIYGCRDGTVKAVEPVPNGFRIDLALGDTGLLARTTARVDDRELHLELNLINTGTKRIRFYTAFPHVAGIRLSDNAASDAYLFPWGGGVIASVPTWLRTAYGENTCWWQMIDVFSPERGGGMYVRVDDRTGLYKCPSLRHGRHVSGEFCLDETGRGYLAPDMQWRTVLEATAGTGMAFDYLRRDRDPGQSFAPPAAVLGTHAGDWREAMRIYAAWAHKVWTFRPYPSALTSCWHITAPGWGQSPLYKDGAYRTDYIDPRYDVAELMSWWTWSDKGPWNTPMDRLEEELGTTFYKRYKAYWVKEPVSGKLMYPLNRGDYDGYMPAWGGLPALRQQIQRIHEGGLLAMFYTDPILACATTKLGQRYGPTYGIMNPAWKDSYHCPKTPPGYVGSYGSYNMCLDTEWYSQWVADTMARVCRETGIDGIRLDEYGHRGYVCTSTKHKHIFAEPGHNAWLQALARNVRQIHRAMDRVRPGLVLTTEFPGHDCMAAALEGAIVYDVRRIKPIRPTPINLFRFYFPECKVFEIDRPHRPEARAWMLWNAEGGFSALYDEAQHAMLKENNDVFGGTDREPLIPTLAPRVYANRFASAEKVFFMLHNARGHTFAGPVLEVSVSPEQHLLDPLRGVELEVRQADGKAILSLRLRHDETRVAALLPRRLRIEKGRIDCPGAPPRAEILVADIHGAVLARLKPGSSLPDLDGKAAPALVKLLVDHQWLDAVPWPKKP